MNDEELIIHVQDYRFLYDLEDARYSNQLIRENAWEEIGIKMRCRGVDCKNRWKALRDCYRKALRAKVTKSGQAATNNKKKWKYEHQMQFLKSFIQCDRQCMTNINPPTPTSVEVSDVEGENSEGTPSRELTSTESSPSCMMSDEIKKRRVSVPQLSPSALAFQEYLNYKKSKENKPADHLHKYFASVVEETVRSLPKELQIKIKTEISTLLHRAEYEAISYPGCTIQPQSSQAVFNSRNPSPYNNSNYYSQINSCSDISYHTLLPSSHTNVVYIPHSSFHTPPENENMPPTDYN